MNVRSLFFVLCLLGLAGCTHVSAYERGKLAHHTMTTDFTGPGQDHVYAVQEGAVGGAGAVGSGCGCN